MRKVFMISVLLAAAILASCATAPASEPAPPPPPPPPVQQPDLSAAAEASFEAEARMHEAFGNRHSSGIILDGASTYTVQRGDTLSAIAGRQYNDGSLYPLIAMVSNIADVDEIEPGMVLTIPVVRTNMDDSTAKQAINRYFTDTARIEEQRGRSTTASQIRNHAR